MAEVASGIGPAFGPVILLLALAIVAVVGSRALRLSPIVGYLLLGIALAGSGLPALMQINEFRSLAELGVVFLLFDVGLHFSFRQVREHAADIFGFGAVQVLLGTAGLGAIALACGVPPAAALLLGATGSLSSTAVVAGLIAERHQQNCPVGLTGTAILIFQDLFAIAILITAGASGGRAVLPAIGLAVLKAVAAFAVAVVLGRAIVRPLFGLVARSRSEEVFTATALLVALAAAGATGAAGLSLTLGAFLGGALLAETPYRAIVQSEIKPFRGLLLGFFFITVGLSLDGNALRHDAVAIVAVAAVLLGAKTALNMAASLAFRWSVPGSVQLGFLLAQGSEFAFVILVVPPVRALLGERLSAVLVAAVALSLALTPAMAAGGRELAGRLRRRRTVAAAPDRELVPHAVVGPVFIAGMGQRGRAVADALREFGIGYAAVERDGQRLRDAIADGYEVAFGDIGDPRLWSAVAMEGRRVSVITAPSLDVSTGLTPMAELRFPRLRRLVAVDDADTASRFAAAGVHPVLDDGPAPGLTLAASVLGELGIAPTAIGAWMAAQRERLAGPSPGVTADTVVA